jgi:phosphatidylinositol alpha-mannosyltransferase
VQTERFRGPDLRSGDERKILFLGRLERRKGLEVLIQAMTRLRDLPVRLVVAGTGPEEKACRRLADRLSVPADFVGAVPEEDLPSLYRSSDVYCAPGLGGESFGIVLIEAMAAGVPVVCSDIPGYRAVAEDAALMSPPGLSGPLAEAIRQVLTEEERAKEMRVASEQVARRYDWTKLASNVELLYERALAS